MSETQKEFTPAEDDLDKFNKRTEPEVPALVQPNEFITVIERLSRMKDIPVDKIEQLFKMKQAEDDRSAKQEFNAAMARAQNRIELVVAKAWNEQTSSHYAKLKEVLIGTKPIYTEEGFSLMFYEGDNAAEGKKRVCADIMHKDGHTKKRHVDLTVTTKGTGGTTFMTQIHGEGSLFSYGRRYLTCMIFNIPTGDDDDGNSAGGDTSEFITEDQAKKLSADITKYYKDDVEFLKHLGAETVDTIYAGKQYNTALQWIKDVKAGKAKKQTREPGEEG